MYFDKNGKLTEKGMVLYPKAIALDKAMRNGHLYITVTGQLTTMGIALCAEAMKLDMWHLLPYPFKKAINEHKKNYDAVISAFQLIKEENIPSTPYWKLLAELDEWLKSVYNNQNYRHALCQKIKRITNKINVNIEELAEAKMMGVDNAPEILQPINNQLYTDELEITFSHPISTNGRFYILNEQAEETASFIIPKNTQSHILHLHPSQFPTGLYYGLLDINDFPKAWKLYIATREDLVNLWQQFF